MFLSGPGKKELLALLEKKSSKSTITQQKQIDEIIAYTPKQDTVHISQNGNEFEAITTYLQPLTSHRKGLLGKCANFILWKCYQVVHSLLYPVLVQQERINALPLQHTQEIDTLQKTLNTQKQEVELLKKQILELAALASKKQSDLEHTIETTQHDLKRKYESMYRTLGFLQNYVGQEMQSLDYEKLYSQGYFEGESYDDYANAKGIMEQFVNVVGEKITPSKVLDVACAYGFIPHYYRVVKQTQAFGVEISPHASRHLGLDYIKTGSIMELDTLFPDERFDLVLCLETFEHFIRADIIPALTQLIGHSNGYLILLISTKEVILDSIDAFHFSNYSREEWDTIFSESGILSHLDKNKTHFLNTHPMSQEMKWANRFWVFDLSSYQHSK